MLEYYTACNNNIVSQFSRECLEHSVYGTALDGVHRKRLSSWQCVKQAMDGLFVAKQQLYRVLKSN